VTLMITTGAALGGVAFAAAPAEAVCPVNQPLPANSGLGVCYSLVNNCINVAVYVSVVGAHSENHTPPICPA